MCTIMFLITFDQMYFVITENAVIFHHMFLSVRVVIGLTCPYSLINSDTLILQTVSLYENVLIFFICYWCIKTILFIIRNVSQAQCG